VHREAVLAAAANHRKEVLERVHTKETAEALLQELPSVLGAFVREDVNGHPREIHLLVSPGPNVKLLAQDVRDLLEERLGIEIDHRVISIAQLAEDIVDEGDDLSTLTDGPLTERRIRFLDVISEVRDQRVRVRSRLQAGDNILEGESMEIDLGAGRMRAASLATLRAAADAIAANVRLELESVSAVRAFDREYVLVCVLGAGGTFGRKLIQLVGAQPIDDDSQTAAALATLKAINRVLGKVLG
jgi:hypothetical protein